MESLRGNRKVLPNYLLDDYVPAQDTKGAFSINESKSFVLRPTSAGESSQQLLESVNGDASDTSGGPLGFLPRRKKKLRQACVYCRRSHLVCEEKRPCHRCVKRGIADRCVDPPQEGQALQDHNWTGAAAEASSVASSMNDGYVSPTPPTAGLGNNVASSSMSSPSKQPNEPRGDMGGGQQKKRKRKAEAPRGSTEWHRQLSHEDLHADHNRPQLAFEITNAASSFVVAPDHGPSNLNPIPGISASALSTAMPQSSASYAPVPQHPMPMQAEPSVSAKGAPSQLLQAQPIFQPPSSAELDSLFSTYFFDVADAFSARLNGAQHPGIPPPPPTGQAPPHYPHQQARHPPNLQHHDSLPHDSTSASQPVHDHRVSYAVPSGPDPRSFQSTQPVQSVPALPQHQLRQASPLNVNRGPSVATSIHDVGSTFVDTAAVPVPAAAKNEVRKQTENPRGSVDDAKEPPGRQGPGDVYSPYPYRKGYASLMRYMTDQNWSEQSIRSVEAALSKIRRLWFSLEDNIQPSSLIQLQAEWAGNVRYFTESVLPFTPVPMVICRKAGEVYSSNQLAQDLCGRSREQMTGGKLSCYELMTEESASKFFRLYELAVGGTQAEDGSYIPTVGKTPPLYWNAEIVQPKADGSHTVIPTRGIFEMKIAPCGLPSLLVCCFVPLT
ncbi:related to RDS2-Transcription factor involved in regulating gluconeogenesis and glyoxylate cycle genes [Sporisorium scitamineum]|uniref:Related to RDS2-Transcription factor involved in regulating gluconeogenesis and glyoxylate cycle genes n=1 Tax=Sporisorium scitamineum TaxID=49012 RepID=A0A0F7RSQ9_9BASI|nr:hypothetical protein [Sporisorium scitamineum]CDU23535.1 related to RDS2-Transcription factor involved in regulating gluconeogenesis and glyoxylate cycle genes [Sporisorium scitamineum]